MQRRLTLNQFVELISITRNQHTLNKIISILKDIDVLPHRYESIAEAFLYQLNCDREVSSYNNNSLPIKVISLVSSRRREIVTKFFSALNLNFTFVDAIDGVSKNFIPMDYQDYHLDYIIPNRSRGHDACSLSHAKVWRQISRQDSDNNTFTLVCEDDVVPLPYFSDLISLLVSNANDLGELMPDIIFINNRASHWVGCEKPEEVRQKFPNYLIPIDFIDIFIQKGISLGLRKGGTNTKLFGGEAYLLSTLGARKLVTFINDHGVIGGDNEIDSTYFGWEKLICQFLTRKYENIKVSIPDKLKASAYIGNDPYLLAYISAYPLCSNLSEMGLKDFSHIKSLQY